MMNRVRPEAPSFWKLARCLASKPKVKVFRRGSSLCCGYSSCSFYVERRGKVTPGGVKVLSKSARRGIAEVVSERHAMLFLYGRDLFEDSFTIRSVPCEEGYALVYWRGVLLGLGKLSDNKLLNVLDFGDFLRRGY